MRMRRNTCLLQNLLGSQISSLILAIMESIKFEGSIKWRAKTFK